MSVGMNDLRIDSLARASGGGTTVPAWNGLRVTHLPTGLVVEVPYQVLRSQARNLKVALAGLGAALLSMKG